MTYDRSVQEAARFLGVSPEAVVRWTSLGYLSTDDNGEYRTNDLYELKLQSMTDMLTPGEAAAALGVSTKTLIRYAGTPRLPCMLTPGGHRRFYRMDIAAVYEGKV